MNKYMDLTTKKSVISTALLVLLVIVVIVSAIWFAFVLSNKFPHQYTIRGESMSPTLTSGQVIELTHDNDTPIQQGDVVVFAPPSEWKASVSQKELVKRVVAVGGDQVDLIRGIEYGGLWVNNTKVVDIPLDYTCESNGASFVMEPDTLLVVGDNVSNSSDSLTRLCGKAPAYTISTSDVLDYGTVEVIR